MSWLHTEASCTISLKTGKTAASSRVCDVKLRLWRIIPLTPFSIVPGTGWSNTEYRTFAFSGEAHTDDLEGYPLDGDNASLEETLESRQRRGKTGPMPSREEQKTLYKKGYQGWDDQGLQMSTADREAAKATGGEEVNGVRI